MTFKENTDYVEVLDRTFKRLKREKVVDMPDIIYRLSKEIDEYREVIDTTHKDYLETKYQNRDLKEKIEGLKKENEYLHDRLKEETERVDLTPAINISIGDIFVTNYPESFLKED